MATSYERWKLLTPPLFKKEQEATFYCDRHHKMMHLNAVARIVWGSLSGGWGGVERRVEELLALSTIRPARKMLELNERYRAVFLSAHTSIVVYRSRS